MTTSWVKKSTAGALFTAACLLPACTPPAGAAVTQCQGSYSENMCTVAVERLDSPTSATLTSSSANLGVDIRGSFTVRSGTATIEIHGGDGPASEITVTPESPAELSTSTRLNRGNRSRGDDPFFTIRLVPNGVAEGLSGTVTYQTRPQS